MSISIIIPVFNREKLICETLNSLLRQTQAASEIIVVDDGSTDGTVEILRNFGDRIRIIQQPNAGPAAARNAGLAVAKGVYVQFFDSDDLASPNMIEAKFSVINATGADIAYGPWMPATLRNGICHHDGIVRQSAAIAESPLDAYLRGWVLFVPNCLIRKELLDKVGGFPQGLFTGEDMLLMFRLLSANPLLAYTPAPLLVVRQHPEGQISAAPSLAKRRMADELHLCDSVLSELGIHRCSGSALRAWTARRTLSTLAAQRFGITVEKPSIRDIAYARSGLALARLRRAARYIALGHRIDQRLSPAPAGSSEGEMLEQLGYTPNPLLAASRLSKTE